ncbi:MAG: AbrB/MazE/SpoVT family DNA-binding domain-containing protein [Thermoplasmata archaeon]
MNKKILKTVGISTRRVSKTGGSLTIRLPPMWLAAQKIKIGDLVILEILQDGSLCIKRKDEND